MKSYHKRIGIFGGSFDPVHTGHLHLANLAKKTIRLDEIWFLPCQISPHKSHNPSPNQQRVDWLELAIEEIPWAKVSMIDLENEGPSYSYLTLQRLAEKFPENRWFWIMGGDQWSAFDRWKNHEIIAEMADFVVLARDGSEIEPRPGTRLHVVEGEHPASSTAIRKALAAGEREIPYLPIALSRVIKTTNL